MTDAPLQESDSPDLRGQRVYMAAADHPRAGEEGVVVGQEPCRGGECGCGIDDLIVRLDDGSMTKVYEPEAGLV